jgi:hypothetical protein
MEFPVHGSKVCKYVTEIILRTNHSNTVIFGMKHNCDIKIETSANEGPLVYGMGSENG